jgi:O-acetyl-ADP-ribose deacetylase (regulator of RNase III)/uncharacterized protein YwgA
MLKVLVGDIFTSTAQTLVNTVNCVGVMGKGVALEFKKRFPAMFDDYAHRCEQKLVKLGEPYLYQDISGVRIINFPTKDHWRSPSRLGDIEIGLSYLTTHLGEWNVTSLALPPLGCGNGGLEWSQVGPLIYRKFRDLPIRVELFAPYGTPRNEMTEDFLAAPTQMELSDRGQTSDKLNPNWVALMEILQELESQPYANPVGRTIFQKICYVATEMGVPTGFEFGKGSYGPFSTEAKLALHEFANRNWVNEIQLGRMMALRVNDQYKKERSKFAKLIGQHQRKIDKAVDLFSRIKNTEQAEEVMTVLYASRQLKNQRPSENVSERQLLDFILEWKKSWANDEKTSAVATAIRNLVLLGWMGLEISESLTEATSQS